LPYPTFTDEVEHVNCDHGSEPDSSDEEIIEDTNIKIYDKSK